VRRLRLVFIGLAVLLLVPTVLLVRSALRSAAYEQQARYRALAERAGDELERELSRLVQEEESRPFGHYRFFYVPPNVTGGHYALTRSPLADAALPPYVVGYFEVEPDGSLRSPRIPREPELAQQRGEWEPQPGDTSADEMRQRVDAALEAANLRRAVIGPPQAPGTTRLQADATGPPEAPADGEDLESYRALLALNRASDERGKPGGKALNINLTPLEDGSGFRVVALIEGREKPLAESELHLAAATAREETWYDPAALLRGETPQPRTVHVHPMTGGLAGPEHVLLMRAAASAGLWSWQGALIDVPALTRWLDDAVFSDNEAATHLRRDYYVQGGSEPPPLERAGLVFIHRFSRPFDSVAVRMVLSPFSELGGTNVVYALGLLVLLTGSAGLYSVYRMVEVTVAFAERRSNFAAAVSHELKTPLTAIRMYAEMLRDGMVPSEDKQREYAGTITTESERLSRLIDNVLEFSRLEQGTRGVELVTGPLGPIVEEAARILEPHARQAGFELRVEIAPDLPPVRYDRDAVLQVVFNLVDNALKYAATASDRRVVLSCTAAEGGVQFCVRDRGPGVPPRHLPRIFEAFYRGENELTRSTRGTGIGLALVRGLAERMGVDVSGRNASDGGFEVALRFPATA
jgi:signal transduction histidine kinase